MGGWAKLFERFKRYWVSLLLAIVCAISISAITGATAYLVDPILNGIFLPGDEDASALATAIKAPTIPSSPVDKMRFDPIRKTDEGYTFFSVPVADRGGMLYLLSGMVVGLYLLKGLFRFCQGMLLRRAGQRVVMSMREELYTHYQDMSVGFFSDQNTGNMMSRVTNDVQMVQNAMPSLVHLFREPLTMAALAMVAFYQNFWLSLIILVVFPLTAFPLVRFGRKVRKYTKRGQERLGRLSSILKENFAGIRVIKAFGMERYEIDRFVNENERVYKANVRQILFSELSSPVIEVMGALAAASVIIFGGMQVITGQSTPGQFFSFLAALGLMYEPLRKINRFNISFQQALGAADRIFQALDQEPTVTEKPGAIELTKAPEQIAFDDISFAYDSEPVLVNLSFDVHHGQVVALVGSSGAGKTTVANLIPRFWDVTSGRILFDKVDLRDLSLNSLRRNIGLVTQETFLFDDTIANNIAYGHGDADPSKIEAAAKAANAHRFVTGFPKGYQTRVGELGVKLSGGQRQRLAIARALFKDAPILILDEATSSLDAESEAEVQAALENLMCNRTTFVIAHRLSTVRKADRILVLSQGRIVEDGRHDELIARNGEYHRLYQIQFQDK
ncbi:MAG: ABC transporter ATP-binding protein [Candidatus Alcyoniella australis]|nr:ABC transporter ATP-binding protein [Candidatus Alcyoniella australis]